MCTGVYWCVLVCTRASLGERRQARGRRAPHGGGGALEARAVDVGEDLAEVGRVRAHAEQQVHHVAGDERLHAQL